MESGAVPFSSCRCSGRGRVRRRSNSRAPLSAGLSSDDGPTRMLRPRRPDGEALAITRKISLFKPASQSRVLYGTVVPRGGVDLYGSSDGLKALASLLRHASNTELVLDELPSHLLEVGPLRSIRSRSPDDGSVNMQITRDALDISGGIHAREMLTRSLDMLAAAPPTGTGVLRHLDVDYFPEHPFLSEQSAWATILLLGSA